MKYVLLLVVVFVVLWWLRGGLRRKPPAEPSSRPAQAAPAAQPMVTCAHCGVHLPQRDAVSDSGGAYCSDAHRLAHGDGPSR